MKIKKICLCEYCIAELRSRGEKLYVDDNDEYGNCWWCKETDDLHECIMED